MGSTKEKLLLRLKLVSAAAVTLPFPMKNPTEVRKLAEADSPLEWSSNP